MGGEQSKPLPPPGADNPTLGRCDSVCTYLGNISNRSSIDWHVEIRGDAYLEGDSSCDIWSTITLAPRQDVAIRYKTNGSPELKGRVCDQGVPYAGQGTIALTPTGSCAHPWAVVPFGVAELLQYVKFYEGVVLHEYAECFPERSVGLSRLDSDYGPNGKPEPGSITLI